MDILQDIFLSLKLRLFNTNGFIFEPSEINTRYGTKNTSGKKRKTLQRNAWRQTGSIGF